MTVEERIRGYIHLLCQDLGVDSAKIYNEKTGAWYFTNGNSTMEVFFTTQKSWTDQQNTYLRCMAPLCNIPTDLPKQFKLFKTVMEINHQYAGFKISADEKRGLVCIVAERNILGMDYAEMVVMIEFLGHWANRLHEFLRAEFPQ